MATTSHTVTVQTPSAAAVRAHFDLVAERPATRASEGVLVLSGLYIAGSAWILAFDNTALATTNLVAGTAMAVVAMLLGADYGRSHGLSYVTPILAVWVLLSPWLVRGLDAESTMIWSNVSAGAIAVVSGLSLAAIATTRRL